MKIIILVLIILNVQIITAKNNFAELEQRKNKYIQVIEVLDKYSKDLDLKFDTFIQDNANEARAQNLIRLSTENKNIRVINIAETQANKKKWNEQKKIYQDKNKTIQRDRSAIEKLIQTIDVSLAQQNPSSKQKSIQNLITKLEHLGQKSEINKTDNKYLQAQIKIDKTLDKVEKKISDSEVGIYVQDKIGQLLNSHAICKARNRCRVKK